MSETPRDPIPSGTWHKTTMAPSALQAGVSLGRYEISEMIGQGGMGEVWKAFDPHRDAHVVIKLLPLLLLGNELELRRIRESFRKVNALQHQHICPVYDLQVDERVGYYLVMKYLEGETLAVHRYRLAREQGAFPAQSVPEVLRPIAAALDYAHGEQIVHRDVKPQNVMVRLDGSDPQLVDFGLADEIRMSTARVSKAQVDISGTYPYMAPEQWRGAPQDGRTDQYALGVVAYELLAGRPPLESADPQIMRLCVLNDDPPELSSISPQANQALRRAMAKNPQDRFESCAAFIDTLAPALLGAQTQSFPPRRNQGAASPFFAGEGEDSLPPSSLAPTAGRSTTGVWIAAAAVGLLAVGGWFYGDRIWNRHGQPTNPSAGANTAAANPTGHPSAASTPVANDPADQPSSADVAGNQPLPDQSSLPASTPAVKPASSDNGAPGTSGTVAGNVDRQLQAQVSQAQMLANKARQDAAGSSSDQYAAATWQAAEAELNAGNLSYASAKFSTALQQYQNAARQYYEAAAKARAVSGVIGGFQRHLQEIADLRKQAEALAAPRLANAEFSEAERLFAEMQQRHADRDYETVVSRVAETKQAYRAAIARSQAMTRAERARATYQAQVAGTAPELLTRHGGAPWQAIQQRILLAEKDQNADELAESYQAAIALLPALREKLRQDEVDSLLGDGNHRQVLALLWPDWKQLEPAMQKVFLDSAAHQPAWWLEMATDEVTRAELEPAKQAMLALTIADSLRRRKDVAGAEAMVDKAAEYAVKVSDPREAMETSLAIAQEIADQGDGQALRDAITRVRVDLDGVNAAVGDTKSRAEVVWLKYYVPLRCAALCWKVGNKELANHYGQLAYASAISSSSFYYDLPAFQAIMIFAEAGDGRSLGKMQHLRAGRVCIYQLSGNRPYEPLEGPEVFAAGQNHQPGGDSTTGYELFCQAELALVAARAESEPLYLVHYRNGSSMAKEFRPSGGSGAWILSVVNARLAMAEAHRDEFVSAAGRIRNHVTHRFPLGEASVAVGRRQLATTADVKEKGIDGAKATLATFAEHPRAALLAKEIAAAIASENLADAIDWMLSLSEPHLQIAARAGIATAAAKP